MITGKLKCTNGKSSNLANAALIAYLIASLILLDDTPERLNDIDKYIEVSPEGAADGVDVGFDVGWPDGCMEGCTEGCLEG